MANRSKQERIERIQNGLNVDSDCFGFNPDTKECNVMTELICAKRKCSFYKPREGCEQDE